jgi:hypothetical protein
MQMHRTFSVRNVFLKWAFAGLVMEKFFACMFNPLPLLFKALLHGQKDRVSFSGHLIYILKQERFRAFRPARDI